MRTFAYTVFALVAFAANSLLCRLALRQPHIDPATFSTIRLGSGAVTLLLISLAGHGTNWRASTSWTSAGVLVLYAVPFAFSYTQLSAADGALILFGCVQATMLIAALRAGERVGAAHWGGLVLALAGLVYLMLPGLSAPPLSAAILMAIAGVGWGSYSLLGRGDVDPLARTTGNFVRAVPIVCAVSVLMLPRMHVEPTGMWLAAASGSLASGVGYAVWYAAVRALTATRAAIVQLSVPVLTAAGGVLFLGERVSARLELATILIVGGIAIATKPTADS